MYTSLIFHTVRILYLTLSEAHSLAKASQGKCWSLNVPMIIILLCGIKKLFLFSIFFIVLK